MEAEASTRAGGRTFWVLLALILAMAFVLRAAYVLTVTQHDAHLYDAAYYELEARSVADGDGFVNPFPFFPREPAADHPPLTVLALVPAAFAVDDERDRKLAMRFTMVLLGLAVVVLVGALGRRLAGDTAGLVAAGIAAVYPNLFMNDGLIMSETLATLTTVGALVLAYEVLRRSAAGSEFAWLAAALGALCGLAALARAELALLVVALALPVCLVATRGGERRTRLFGVGATLSGAVLVVAPWVGFNLSRFEEPTFLSTGDGPALLGANCRSMWFTDGIGLWDATCLPGKAPRGDQSELARIYRDRAWDFATSHLDRAPVVALARLGRVLNVYEPIETARYNVREGRPEWASYWGMAMFFVLVGGAVVGAIVLRRRHQRIWPLLVPVGIVLLAAVAFYGQPRFRAPAEPTVVVLAAVAVAAWPARRRPSGELEASATERA